MKRMTAALFAFTVFANPALAADQHHHDGMHGGKIVETPTRHIEIVAKDGVLELHVADEGMKPEDVKDAKASAAVLSEGKKVDVTLTPSAGNVLTGTGAFKAGKGTTIVVTLTMPGQAPEQARLKID